MGLSTWPVDTGFQRSQSTMEDFDMYMDTAHYTGTGTYVFLPSQTVCDNGKHKIPFGSSEETEHYLAEAHSECPPQYYSREPSPAPQHRPIHNVPVEILLRIFRLIAPSRTRDSLYDLSKLTHVCRFWRVTLVNQPRVWSTVFVTQSDCRSFVEACLRRSHPVPLDVTVDTSEVARTRSGCTCGKDSRRRLFPNESIPCEWHFQFESLAEPKYSSRIHTLNINFDGGFVPYAESEWLALGSCRFFTSPFPRLATIKWENEATEHANYLFTIPPFPPTLRSLTYVGAWGNFIAPVSNLTSFVFDSGCSSKGTSVEAVRLFLLNNQSLESLDLKYVDFEGDSKGPPVHLLNLKSLVVCYPVERLSTIIRVPPFCRLSSLQISSSQDTTCSLYATGDGITFSAECFARNFAETWGGLTGYARPTIRHIRLEDGPGVGDCGDYGIMFISVLSDAHTLEIGNGYFPFWYDRFLDDLKHLGPQLKVIRFAISDKLEPFKRSDEYEACGGFLLDQIEELVKYRFERGHPFSTVERMVVGGSEWANRQQDYVWRCFYGSRKLCQYVRPG